MDLRKLISKFVTQICEKNYSQASESLDSIITEKVKSRIKNAKKKIEDKDNCDCKSKSKCKCENKSKNSKKSSKKVTKKG